MKTQLFGEDSENENSLEYENQDSVSEDKDSFAQIDNTGDFNSVSFC